MYNLHIYIYVCISVYFHNICRVGLTALVSSVPLSMNVSVFISSFLLTGVSYARRWVPSVKRRVQGLSFKAHVVGSTGTLCSSMWETSSWNMGILIILWFFLGAMIPSHHKPCNF